MVILYLTLANVMATASKAFDEEFFPSLALDVHQTEHIANIDCSTFLVPVFTGTEQCPFLQDLLNADHEIEITLKSYLNPFNSKLDTKEPEAAIIDSLNKSVIFVPFPSPTSETIRNETMLALANGMLYANLNCVERLAILYPGPSFCTGDFSEALYTSVFVRFMEKVIEQKQDVKLNEIHVYVKNDQIFESLPQDLVNVGEKFLLSESVDESLCTQCEVEKKVNARHCQKCIDTYPDESTPFPISKTAPETEPVTKPSEPSIKCSEKEVQKQLAELFKYLRKDLKIKFADHHADKYLGERLHSLLKVKLNFPNDKIHKYSRFWLIGYAAGSFAGGFIPRNLMIPEGVCRVAAGMGGGTILFACVLGKDRFLKLLNKS